MAVIQERGSKGRIGVGNGGEGESALIYVNSWRTALQFNKREEPEETDWVGLPFALRHGLIYLALV